MKVYRVFPHDVSAAPTDRGGTLYVPPGGVGRVDNPDAYHVLYAADCPEAAIAEAFGRLPLWSAIDFVHPNEKPYAVAEYDLAENSTIFNLNDTKSLAEIGVGKPSDIVTRDRRKTQAWARAIYAMQRYAGVTWWSYYNPDWSCYGIWTTDNLACVSAPIVITTQSISVRATALAIARQIDS